MGFNVFIYDAVLAELRTYHLSNLYDMQVGFCSVWVQFEHRGYSIIMTQKSVSQFQTFQFFITFM